MLIKLNDVARRRLREDLAAHRARSALTDADYCTTVLRVSLNTLKKCLDPGPDLTIKRRTFAAIIQHAGLDPARYGGSVPSSAGDDASHGGYSKTEFGFLAGQYLLHRRSFLTAENITRSVLEIAWDSSRGCLIFTERMRYVSDAGVTQSFDYSGDIFIHADRVLMTLVSSKEGEVRMTMLHTPSRRSGKTPLGPIRMAGVVLTHGYPKRFYQPVVGAVAVEQVMRSLTPARLLALSKTLAPGTAEFDAAAADLKVAEEHAVVFTPLLWRERKP